MKAFKFRLEAVKKLREFKEKKIKIELGEIVKGINDTKIRIVELNEDIDVAYRSQEKLMERVADARLVSFYPYYVQGKKDDISANESRLYSLQKRYEQKVQEMQHARGEVKIIEKLEDKEFEKYKKEYTKKEFELIDDFQIMRHQFAKDQE